MLDDIESIIDDEHLEEDAVPNATLKGIINNLELYSNDIEMLTKLYTEIFTDENVVYVMTRISQNRIFSEHFPELYEKNEYGESVINCQQNSPYHRYGVFKHTLYCMESVGKDNLKYSTHDVMLLKWTMFLHDIGKPFVKAINSSGQDSFAGHDDLSVEMAKKILERFDFEESDKKTILTLIKYHDRYLNEGEITYDNLSFLARELDNKKELFYLLIEVKLADNKSKSMEVYNKFMVVVTKYYDFANEYFNYMDENIKFNSAEELITTKEEINIDDSTTEIKSGEYFDRDTTEEITDEEFKQISKNIINGQKLKYYYQPIVNIKKGTVHGYELFVKVSTPQGYGLQQILKKAKELDKYDKIQQMLFINSLENYATLKEGKKCFGYINIDVKSYDEYVNKPRIFDMLEDNKIFIEFNNYESFHVNEINKLVKNIKKSKGYCLLDNFESSSKSITEINGIIVNQIKYNIGNVKVIDSNIRKNLQELSVFCMSNSIKLVISGINTIDKLKAIKEFDVEFAQGEFLVQLLKVLTYKTKISNNCWIGLMKS